MEMDRAARVVRRSGVKLLSIGGGHADLNLVISEQKDVKNTAKAFMAAQNSAARYLTKWAGNEDNRALQDVTSQIVELNCLWTEAQREFTEHLKAFRQMFEMLLESERHIDQAKANLAAFEHREMKIKKELKKAAKKFNNEEVRFLEGKLMQAERQKHLGHLEVQDRQRENAAVKLIRFKEAMLRLSEAYVELGHKCAIIFEAQRDISFQLPDAYQTEVEEFKYTGSGTVKQHVLRAKEQVRQCRDQSQLPPIMHQTIDMEEPPPPYSPGDYFDNLSRLSADEDDEPTDAAFQFQYRHSISSSHGAPLPPERPPMPRTRASVGTSTTGPAAAATAAPASSGLARRDDAGIRGSGRGRNIEGAHQAAKVPAGGAAVASIRDTREQQLNQNASHPNQNDHEDVKRTSTTAVAAPVRPPPAAASRRSTGAAESRPTPVALTRVPSESSTNPFDEDFNPQAAVGLLNSQALPPAAEEARKNSPREETKKDPATAESVTMSTTSVAETPPLSPGNPFSDEFEAFFTAETAQDSNASEQNENDCAEASCCAETTPTTSKQTDTMATASVGEAEKEAAAPANGNVEGVETELADDPGGATGAVGGVETK